MGRGARERETTPCALVVVLGLAVLFLGCESVPVPGAACGRASDCRTPLVCSYGRCRAECEESRDCPLGARCIASSGVGVCTLDVENRCDTDVCPSPLRCVGEECRTECRTLNDCISGACVMSTCVEPISGEDAGTPEDAAAPEGGLDDAGVVEVDAGLGTCLPAPLTTLAALVGTATRGRGLSTRVAQVVDLPVTSTILPDVLAATTLGTGAFAGTYVGTVAEGAPRLWSAAPADLAFAPRDLWPGLGTSGWSLDLASDEEGSRMVAVFMRQPASESDAYAYVIDTAPPASDLSTHALSPMRSFGAETFHGATAIVGGTSPFHTSVIPTLYVFHTNTGPGSSVGAALDTRDPLSWRRPGTVSSAYENDWLEMRGGDGPLVLLRNPVTGAVGHWRPGPGDTSISQTEGTAPIVDLRATSVALPGVASRNGVETILAWAEGDHVELSRIVCGSTDDCFAEEPLGTVAVGARVSAVALAPLADGYALAVAREGGTIEVFLLEGAALEASRFHSAAAVAAPTPVAGEEVRALEITAAPTALGASVVVTVLAQSATARRIWAASYDVCPLP